ncbi:hypothetical protein LWI29_019548 [Acer saccharum]|uniref:Uncharacterized protein n=1 Tax=Acer saccharum TaxID=4024 RepID=A0AA39W7A3_ACESA|nr:hypothetical protein LWI29_019548 [Acer saccharum]
MHGHEFGICRIPSSLSIRNSSIRQAPTTSGTPLGDLRWWAYAGVDQRTTGDRPLGDLCWWACAGVDQRTTSDRQLGDLRWWACAGVDQRTTNDRPLGDLCWWAYAGGPAHDQRQTTRRSALVWRLTTSAQPTPLNPTRKHARGKKVK